MGQALQPAPAGIPVAFCYERRRHEETTLYQVVQEQLETFLAQAVKLRRSEQARADEGFK